MPPRSTEVKHIKITVDARNSKDLKRVADQMGRLDRSAKATAKTAGKLSFAFNAFLGVQAFRFIRKASDEFQLIKDRIRVFSRSSEEAEDIFGKLAKAAEFTKSSIGGLGTVYNRLALSTKNLGLSQNAVIDLTTALQQTFRITGTTLEEARAASIQFAQGLSSGALRGDELRSVTENNAFLVQLLAKEFGVASGRIKDLGKEGKLTADVIVKVLAKNFDSLNKKAAGLGTTIEQGMIISLDKLRLRINKFAEDIGLSSKISKGLEFMTNNFDDILDTLTTIVTTGVILKIASQLKTLVTTISTGGLVGLLGKGGIIGGLVGGSALAFKKIFEKPERDATQLKERLKELDKEISATSAKIKSIKESDSLANKLFGSFKINSAVKDLEKLKVIRREVQADIDKVSKKKTVDPGSALKKEADNIKKVQDALTKSQIKNARKIELQRSRNSLELLVGIKTEREYAVAVSETSLKLAEKKFIEDGTRESFEAAVAAQEKHLRLLKETPSVAEASKKALDEYAKSATNLGENIAGAITNTLKGLEDTLVKFVRTGKLEFKDLVDSILDDLARIAIRQSITGPLAQAIGGAFGGGSTPTPSGFTNSPTPGQTVVGAKGMALYGGQITPFARGGVISTPTTFPISSGTGLVGEAGAEGILPLTRVKGDLGVKAAGNVIVNVINNTGAEVETTETTGPNDERQLNVMITNAVNQGINGGEFDRSFGESFGLSRRGR